MAVLLDGVEVDELLRQPLRLALLIHLTVEREAARDDLQRLLWPRRKAEKARHSLNQLIYQLRSVLGRDAIATRGDFVRIGDSVIADCARFELGLAEGGEGREGEDDALGLYQGPFLDGFSPPTSAFADWAGERRERYLQLARAALRRRAHALLLADDRTGAVEVARAWERADPESAEAGEFLRTMLDAGGSLRAAASFSSQARAVPRSARPSVWPIAAALAVTIAALGITLGRGGAAPAEPAGGGGVIVGIVPFAGEPAPPDPDAPHRAILEAVGWLPEVGAVELTDLRSPASGWGEDRGRAEVAAARERGITYMVAGAMAEPGTEGAVTLEAWHAPSGNRVLRTSTLPGERPSDALARLGIALITTIADREDLGLGLPSRIMDDTRSPVALGHFMRGRQLMRRGESAAARAAFDDAIRADSGFGYAWARAAFLDAWHDGAPGAALRSTTRALERSDLENQPRRLIEAIRHHAEGRPHDAERAFRAVLTEDPRSPDAHAGLALVLDARTADPRTSSGDAMESYRALLRLDPSFPRVHERLFELSLLAGDHASAQLALLHMAEDEDPPIRRLVLEMLHGPDHLRAAALDSMRWLDGDEVTTAFGLLVRSPGGAWMADSLGAILQQSIRTPSERERGADLRLVALSSVNRWEQAIEAWQRTGDLGRGSLYIVAAHLAGWPAGDLARTVYDLAERDLARGGGPDPTAARRILAHRASIHGDSADVVQALRWLSTRQAAPQGPGDAEVRALGLALAARLHLLAADTAQAISALESAMRVASWRPEFQRPLACLGPQRLLAIRLHSARGELEAAERWERSLRASPCPASRLFTPLAAPLLDG